MKPQGRWAVFCLGSVPLMAVLGLLGFLTWNGLDVLTELSPAQFFSMTWLPFKSQFGMVSLLLGTLATTVLALIIAVPLGLGTAIYLSHFAGPRVRTFSDAAVGLLGGMPSVIIGLWGLTWIVPSLGHTLASAVLVLAVMIAPTLTLLSGAALRQVPPDLLEAARALGVSETMVVWVAMRHAGWTLIGAITLAACRGLGEAVALSMVAGNVGGLPSWLEPVATLTTTLILEFDGATGLPSQCSVRDRPGCWTDDCRCQRVGSHRPKEIMRCG